MTKGKPYLITRRRFIIEICVDTTREVHNGTTVTRGGVVSSSMQRVGVPFGLECQPPFTKGMLLIHDGQAFAAAAGGWRDDFFAAGQRGMMLIMGTGPGCGQRRRTDKGACGTDGGSWRRRAYVCPLGPMPAKVFMTEGKRGTVYVDKQGAPAVAGESSCSVGSFFKDQGRYGIQDKNGEHRGGADV